MITVKTQGKNPLSSSGVVVFTSSRAQKFWLFYAGYLLFFR